MSDFIAFNMNAVSNFLYVLTSNTWFFMLLLSVIGTITMLLKEEVDDAVREEQNII
uniref:hypothetical protein n=1 Tax=Lachnoclostridium phocaeense TaxID=1871021 RepID=UPI0026DB604D|nr:hypothetical protein [Lachnoclostridium phocaeense]